MKRDVVFWLAAGVFAFSLGGGHTLPAFFAVAVMTVCWLSARAVERRRESGERMRRSIERARP